MLRGRNLRQPGETLILGETEYCVEGVQGQGGSAVVYRARYEDSLNRGCYHHVLIKELFPYHPKGWVYRDEQGWIRCCPEGESPGVFHIPGESGGGSDGLLPFLA